MKHSDYLFTPCKACGEEFPDTSREQDTRPAAEVWERRSRHWRKAALEFKKERDGLLEAVKALELADFPTFYSGPAHLIDQLAAAIKLAEGEANGS